MSGILAIWSSKPNTPWYSMLQNLKILGSDGIGEWHDRKIGLSLGRTQFFNTPESCQESAVIKYKGCILVWSGRIDERESLLTGENFLLMQH